MYRLLSVIFLVSVGFAAAQSQEPVKMGPNIIFINSDDQGFQLGCGGDPNARTPELDRFANENVLFTHACVAQSSCSPSRSSVLTGLYPHQSGQIGLAHLGYRMRSDIRETLPKLLSENGYKCGIIGKLHVAPFEPFVFPFSRFSDFHPPKDSPEADAPHMATRDWQRMVGAVREFLGETRSPFFLYVNLFDPHRPFLKQVNGLPANPVGGKDLKPLFETMHGGADEIADYYNGVERLDSIFGKIREVLEKNGVWENSLVVYWGDNGQPFDGAKATSTEGAFKVPLIVHWPGNHLPRKVTQPVSVVDLYRTALEAAGVSAPSYAQGVSLIPFVTGKEIPEQAVYAERNAHGVSEYHPERVVYSGGLKVVVDFTKSQALKALDQGTLASLDDPAALKVFLYAQDPDETQNVVGEAKYRQDIENALRNLGTWMKNSGDFLLSSHRREVLAKAQTDAFATKGEAAHMTLPPEEFTGPISASPSN